MIFDELSSSLNLSLENKILSYIKHQTKNGTTIISVTHSPNFINHSDSIIFIDRNTIRAWGKSKNIISSRIDELKEIIQN